MARWRLDNFMYNALSLKLVKYNLFQNCISNLSSVNAYFVYPGLQLFVIHIAVQVKFFRELFCEFRPLSIMTKSDGYYSRNRKTDERSQSILLEISVGTVSVEKI